MTTPGVPRRPPASRTRAAALRAFGLDVVYERGEGDRLFYRDGTRELAVWDFLGGYGASFFGHNHPALTETMLRFLSRGGVTQSQASVRSSAETLRIALADRLSADTGRTYEIVFGSTGAEAVEIAAKHAEMAYAARASAKLAALGIWHGDATHAGIAEHNASVLTAAPAFIALRRGFHGMTARALELTDDPEGRFGGRAANERFRFVEADRAENLCDLLAELTRPLFRVVPHPSGWQVESVDWTCVAGFFIEPIQGEGGIHPVAPETARAWQATCRGHRVPLIADEIQSGMGRTGSFLFSRQLGLSPDYVLLGKSLGGGLAKISAVAVARDQWLDDFALKHSSTFAEDDLSALVALRALDLLDSEGAYARALERGDRLQQSLSALAARHPDIIAGVRGRGVMLGLEWRRQSFDRSPALRFLQRYGWLGYAVSGYLLRKHGIRVAPALSMGLTLRIQPSYSIPERAVGQLLEALDALCELLRRQDAGAILGPCIGVVAWEAEAPRATGLVRRPARPGSHVGFVGHFIDADSVALWDPSLGRLGEPACVSFLEHVRPFAEPLVCHRDDVHSITGAATSLTFIGIPVSSQQCYDALRTPERRALRDLVQRAVDMAVAEGCSVVGLGGYCSILTRSGKDLRRNGVALTTGNGHTVAAGLLALMAAAGEAGIEPSAAHAAVLGATGNIGSVLAELLARQVASIVLIGRPARRAEMEALALRIRTFAGEHAPRGHIRITDDPAACREASLVVAASNTPGPILRPEHVGTGPTVILDLAVPGDVHPSVMLERPHARVIRGGVIRTPCNPGWYVPGIPLERGTMFACMAETALMGLEGDVGDGSLGALSTEQVLRTSEIARKHGFAGLRAIDATVYDRSLMYSR